ncbi:MAG TPA: HEAT repeat domain-containing protein [Vicinamibacteria bacterium]|nr:HEAT repeat domain-containing protein [Vicinamibacteria bacterium]
MTPAFAEACRDWLLTFLTVSSLALALMLVVMIVQRLARTLAESRWQQALGLYRPLVDSLLQEGAPPETFERLAQVPRRHQAVLASLLLAPLRVVTGEMVDRIRAAAERAGLVARWTSDLRHRRWWTRAEAALALGLVREPSAAEALVAALEDEHEEVRAAAVDALGLLGDPRAIPALVLRLSDESRHQRVRIVESLREFGQRATPALLAHARSNPAAVREVADLVGLLAGAEAGEDLLQWSAHEDPSVRAAALRALGTIGPDDRAYYYALRALGDESAEVRAMAARALGRSRRAEAAPYLAEKLEDEWEVAAHSATALRELGAPGIEALSSRAAGTSPGADLARQMLWEARRDAGAT